MAISRQESWNRWHEESKLELSITVRMKCMQFMESFSSSSSFCLARKYFVRCSVIQSCQTLQPHGLQQARLSCPSLSPGVHSNSCPWLRDAIQASQPLSPSSPSSPFCPRIRVFSIESALHIRWPRYWSFSFCISPSNKFPGLISFRIGWFDLLAVQGPLKSLLQWHNSKASILQLSAFLKVQFSQPYMTPGETIALIVQTFVSKVMSLLFNMLSRFVIAFLPRSKHLLISWLQSPGTVILEPKKIKSVTVSTSSPSVCHEVMGLDAMIFFFWMLSFKPAFSLSSFTLIKRLFSSSSLSAIRWYHVHIWDCWYFSLQFFYFQV